MRTAQPSRVIARFAIKETSHDYGDLIVGAAVKFPDSPLKPGAVYQLIESARGKLIFQEMDSELS